ncbi:sporulation protein YqfD [Desulforudis sp. 1088]|uniref:sporulation protein YqfD n=1 Tax=unclassified Candidatus Desulforudis TaxID=2635950 RepID=UPI003CE4A2EB
MFILRILAYLFGQVTMVVKGRTLEKFINMATTRGIHFWDVKRLDEDTLVVRTTLSAVKPLRHIARRTSSRFHITEKKGLPFALSNVLKRKPLLIGVVVFVSGLYLLSSFVWFIDVEGNKSVPREEILRAAREAGIYRGTAKWSFENSAVEDGILERIPRLSWVGVRLHGTKAIISVAEKKLPAVEIAPGRSDIVAGKAGLVEDVLVLKGQAVVKDGQTVLPGEVLISGEIWPAEAVDEDGAVLPREPRYVRAKGIVRARVWYEEYGEMALVEEGMQATGRVAQAWSIKIGRRQINIKGSPNPPYKDYERTVTVRRLPGWRNLVVPVEVVSTTFREIKPYKRSRSREEAFEAARNEVLEAIRSQLPKEYKILNQKVEIIKTGRPEELVRVRASVEVLEDIGVERTLK